VCSTQVENQGVLKAVYEFAGDGKTAADKDEAP